MRAQRYFLATTCVTIAIFGWADSTRSPSRVEQVPAPKKVDFNRQVRPLLAKHCWTCHGADPDARKSALRLDTAAGIAEQRDGGRPVEPGSLAKSLIWARLNPTIPALQMPPADSGIDAMSPAEKAIVKQWIEEGGTFQSHWAFEKPVRHDPPAVKSKAWARTWVDAFILARLEAEGLTPQPEADAATLLRRASLTLVGLPPTPEELKAFLADKRPEAYERAVDRLLASPLYGEHQARYWLDAVRYGDTHGLHLDNERSIWPYRDWVVRAFNEDLPYDQFITWQLAGDLLPNPTTEQRIATGYVRMNPTTSEGGAIDAEFLAKNTFDRVDTTSTVMQGITLACSRCHDHKYDPFTQRDYFGMYAFFNSTKDAPLDGNALLHGPVMKAPTPTEAKQLADWDASLGALVARVDAAKARVWAEAQSNAQPVVSKWERSGPYVGKTFDEAFDTAFPPEKPLAEVAWEPTPFDGKPLAAVVGRENAAVYLRTTLTVTSARPVVLRVGSDDGVAVWLNGKQVHKNKVARALAAENDPVTLPVQAGANTLMLKIVNGGGADGAAASFGDPMVERLKPALSKNDATSRRAVAEAFLEAGPSSPDAEAYRALVTRRRALDATLPSTLVAEELPKPRSTFVLRRGEYDREGAPVTRAVPKVFGWLPSGAPVNRLGLARWMTDARNPLTARVIVNRIWQQNFGTGIVASSEDFGSRGEFPSHPELLDTLSVTFREEGWSIKDLHKLLLTSATFRQRSVHASSEKDPENRLLARGPRYRLDAEVLRDQALALAGLLVRTEGGKGVKPYQPPGLWEEIAYPSSNTSKYVQDHGADLYRRSIYLFWKRTSPPPALLMFDAPMRESCVVRRTRTNTPLQALASLNAPSFFEAARVMAQRVLASPGGDDARLAYAFSLATARPPNAVERGILRQTLAEQRAAYRDDPVAAAKILKVGESPVAPGIAPDEHAAWTLLCNLILNLDEAVTLH